MNFPFFKRSNPQKNFFLCLLIKPFNVGAILFEEINEKLFILSTNEIDVEQETDKISYDELLAVLDQVISFVERSLPEGASLEKTIFSLPYEWIENSKIKKEYLGRLKRICEALGLVPIGFLTSIEAIVNSMEKTEGAPVSALFIEITKDRLFAYLVRLGKILEVVSESVSPEIIKTAETVFKKIEAIDVLPAKIVLLDYEGGESVQQKFLSHKWSPEIPFLHVPQVVVLERGFENEAAINGVATQMELEVLSDVKIQEDPGEKGALEEATASEFGFVKDKDIAIKGSEKPVIPESMETEDIPDGSTDEKGVGEPPKESEPDVNYFKATRKVEKMASLPIGVNLPGVFSSIKNLRLLNFKKILFSFSSLSSIKVKAGIALVGLIAFIIAFSFIYYSLILSAKIIIFADKKAVDKNAEVSFSTNPTQEDQIKLELVEQEIKGHATKNSTGEKETGEKAKGTVTIYSSLSREQTFSKGTAITSVSNKRGYTLDENVKVASSSGVTDVKTTKAQVTASEIGKEFNLPSGTKFTVGTFDSSEVEAKNDSAFSGGTKKTSTVVSRKDLEDLLSQVTEDLKSQAVSKVKSGISSRQAVFPDAMSVEVVSEKYSKKEGEEAGSVELSATIKYSIGTYNQDDLEAFVSNLSKNQVPGSYVLKMGDSKINLTDIKVRKDGANATSRLQVKAVYVPELDSSKLAGLLKGKSSSTAEKEIKNINGVTDLTIIFERKLPLFPVILPVNGHNIDIEIRN